MRNTNRRTHFLCLCWRSWKGRLVGLLPAPLGIREHEVNNENKDEDEDTPCTLLMLFECWVSLKQPLALHLWACPWWLSFTVFTFYWGVVSWMRWAEAVDWKPAETSINSGNPVEGRCSFTIIIILVLILVIIILWIDTARRCRRRHILVFVYETSGKSIKLPCVIV